MSHRLAFFEAFGENTKYCPPVTLIAYISSILTPFGLLKQQYIYKLFQE